VSQNQIMLHATGHVGQGAQGADEGALAGEAALAEGALPHI
jgi:hypothetical protein